MRVCSLYQGLLTVLMCEGLLWVKFGCSDFRRATTMSCLKDRVSHQDPYLGKGLLHTSKGLSAWSCLCSKSWLHHHINNNRRVKYPYSAHVMRMHEVSHLGWKRILAMMSVSQVLFVFLVHLASIILVQTQFCLKVALGVVQWLLQPWSSHLKEEKKEGYKGKRSERTITPCSSFEHL